MVSREIGKLRNRIEKVKKSFEYIPKSMKDLKKELYEIGESLGNKEEKFGATIIRKEHKSTERDKKWVITESIWLSQMNLGNSRRSFNI